MRTLAALTISFNAALAIQNFAVPGWDLQCTTKVGNNLASLSSPSYDSSSWYHIGSRATVFAGLIEAGEFNTEQLFYSKNLQNSVDYLPYYSPWLYRSEIKLQPGNGSHFFLLTNGITSKADIYLNGNEVANKYTQAGAYGGQTYDITNWVKNDNALLIQAWPTFYDKDFALGWVDWNSYPPDNGTGVWREVDIKQTGSLFMGPMRVYSDYVPGANSTQVTLAFDVTNMEMTSISGSADGKVMDGDASAATGSLSQTFTLQPSETRTIYLTTVITDPKIWWPKEWGDQPLYTAQATLSVGGRISDDSGVKNFGIRRITSIVNEHVDRMFSINGHPFQVRGGGYAPDVFLRWNSSRFEAIAQYVLDMGLNTIRLEGKEEQPEMYDIADRMGLMIMPGWECCDKWEGWKYNDEVTGVPLWNENDLRTANMSMRHEASMLQTHPCVLAFLIGSDYWPDAAASGIYVKALHDFDWPNPIVASAAKRGWPENIGPGGMKMRGPYDWVPPNYWYWAPRFDRFGTAYGFGSELGAGVGTPEIGSLKKFLTEKEMNDLWKNPEQGLYHMSTNVSSFHYRTRYNKGLWGRYGKPTSLDDYLLKAQIMDYEATRAEYEAYSARWNADRPATGLIYWMLNNAWPSLHWNLFDYYLHPAGSYFGTKVGSRSEHVAYDYEANMIYLINHSLNGTGSRTIDIELIDTEGNTLAQKSTTTDTVPNTSKAVITAPGLSKIKDVAFMRLMLSTSDGTVLSRNVYWLATSLDQLEWNKSTWYYTPCSEFADYTALNDLKAASVSASVAASGSGQTVTLHNTASVPAFFISLNVVDSSGDYVVPVLWSDNYVTLFPDEKLELEVSYSGSAAAIEMSGSNVATKKMSI